MRPLRLILVAACVFAVGCTDGGTGGGAGGSGGSAGGDGGGSGASGGGTGGGTGGGSGGAAGGGDGGGSAGGGAGGAAGGGSGAAGGGTGGTGGTGGGGGSGGDAGCVGGAATHLGFASAPQTVDARACSAALKAQIRDVCGAAVNAGASTELFFSATGSLEFYGDPSCIGKPSMWVVPAGASGMDVYFKDTAQEMSTVTVSSAGLDSGTQVQTIVCPAGEKACPGASSCIPATGCCEDADCAVGTAAKTICNTTTNTCRHPTCAAFYAGCTSTDFMTFTGTIQAGSPFTPKCVGKATSTSSVSFNSSGIHQAEQACGPTEITISAFGSASGFSGFGTWGFRCKNHPTSTFERGAIKSPP